MFNPSEELESGWVDEVRQEVTEECSKFGAVTSCLVDANSNGHVYVIFSEIPGAQRAQAALHNRRFSGRRVVAEFLPEELFGNQHPVS